MHRYDPKIDSKTAPRICADECQNVYFPKGSSNFSNSREQSPSNGLLRSHSSKLDFFF